MIIVIRTLFPAPPMSPGSLGREGLGCSDAKAVSMCDGLGLSGTQTHDGAPLRGGLESSPAFWKIGGPETLSVSSTIIR